tara:strand:+ start:338 stop:1834 length:1497 start_codon:yes stop_codon:yes gene_type:complete
VVATPSVVDIPINRIKVSTRLRGTDPDKIQDLAESIEGVGLLHAVTVSRRGDDYLLLAGNHRLESFRLLGRETIPATIQDADPLLEELIEIEENLISNRLSPVQEANHIVRWEDLLSQLGKRATSGDNRWNRSGLTNDDLAKSRGVSKRTYQLTKSIANINPEAQDIIESGEYEYNKMDLVALAKENDEVQLEVANMIATGQCRTFKRALQLARCKIHKFDWDEEKARLKEQIGMPFSVRKWTGESTHLLRLCKLVSEHDDCRVTKKTWGTLECPNYAQHPDQSAYFINYYSNEGDLILDNFSGRGTNLLVGAALGRRVVGYDLSINNLNRVRQVCLEHTEIEPDDLMLHHSDGVELVEYKDQENIFDLITTDSPYHHQAESYGDDPRDLCQIKDYDEFYQRLETCLVNLKRLIKPSNFKQKEFHPIVMKCGSSRRGSMGFMDMATELEIIGRKLNLVLHDKVINVLDSQWSMFNTSRCIDHRYSVKNHETSLVFVKY